MNINDINKLPLSKQILLIWVNLEKKNLELMEEVKSELDSRLEHQRDGNVKYYTSSVSSI